MAGRILVLDDVATHRIVARARLASAAYDVVLATGIPDALRQLRVEAVDLVLVGGEPGLAPDLCDRLRDTAGCGMIPIILTRGPSDAAARRAVRRRGFDVVLGDLPGADKLLAWVRNLIRRRNDENELSRATADCALPGLAEPGAPVFRRPGRITVIAPSLAEASHLRTALAPQMRDRIDVASVASALSDLGRGPSPDAVVLGDDPATPGAALRLMAELRARPATRHVPILLLANGMAEADTITALDFGVTDLIDDAPDAQDLADRLRRDLGRKAVGDSRRAAMRDSLRLASIDPLTGLYNRRYAMAELDRIRTQARRDGSGFAVMMLDLDRFKRINDTRGHAAGDAVLVEVARRLPHCLRQGDLLARIGGEEFLAVIPACDDASARRAAERLRRCVSARPIAVPDGGAPISITISIGLLVNPDCQATAAGLMDLADRALYASKAQGRDQVTTHMTAA